MEPALPPGSARVLPSALAFAPRPQGTTVPQLPPSAEAHRRLLGAVQLGGDIDGYAAVLRTSRSMNLSSDDSRDADGSRAGDGAVRRSLQLSPASPSIKGVYTTVTK